MSIRYTPHNRDTSFNGAQGDPQYISNMSANWYQQQESPWIPRREVALTSSNTSCLIDEQNASVAASDVGPYVSFMSSLNNGIRFNPYPLQNPTSCNRPTPEPEIQIRVLETQTKQCWDHGCNGRIFSTSSNLLRHQREQSGAASKSKCPLCGRVFTRSTARNTHIEQGKCKVIRDSSRDDVPESKAGP